MPDDFDIVSDLNEGTADHTISAHDGAQSANGGDAVNVNNQQPRPAPIKQVAVDPEEAPEKPLSLRDQITSAIRAQENTDTPAAASQDGRPRAPNGQFAPKADGQEQVVDPAAAAPSTAAPEGIDPTVFSSLPAETQGFLARTMEDVKVQRQRFAALEPIEQLIAPRIQAWAINRMSPAQALQQLLALSDFATNDTPGFIKYFARENSVDLEELVFGMAVEETPDPKYKALEDQIKELQGFRDNGVREQQQAAHQRTVDSVIAFAGEKGQDGQLLRPYLTELGESWLPYIGMVMQQNPNWTHAQIMQQAYENACWNNPGVRGKMQAAAETAAEAERLRKATERATAARAASASIPSGSPSSPPVAPADAGRSVRDTIRAAIAQHS